MYIQMIDLMMLILLLNITDLLLLVFEIDLFSVLCYLSF